MSNNGKEYEQFVSRLQQALIDSEEFLKQKNITIETNKKIKDSNGQNREFDVYWEFELSGINYKNVIECKDYKNAVSLEKIDAFIGKLTDFPNFMPIYATKTGYQSGVKAKAEKHKVNLLIVRNQNDSDWEDQDGNPYIKSVHIKTEMIPPAEIINFTTVFDRDWIKENTDASMLDEKTIDMSSDNVFIEDLKSQEPKYSAKELTDKLCYSTKGEYGIFNQTKNFENAFIYFGLRKFKLTSYTIEYRLLAPITMNQHLDFSKDIIGVIEDVLSKSKTAVYNDKVVRNWR